MVGRAQLGGAGGSLVWATYAGTGLSKPNLYRQTTRHEVAVAAASARYAAAGYAWQRDEKPAYAGGHQADGVALGPGWVELIEVELTGKRMPRYVQIFQAFRNRFDLGQMSQVTYLCNAESARAVRGAQGNTRRPRDRRPGSCHEVYDRAGLWPDASLPAWLPNAERAGRVRASDCADGPGAVAARATSSEPVPIERRTEWGDRERRSTPSAAPRSCS